jgi:hypothetical protein
MAAIDLIGDGLVPSQNTMMRLLKTNGDYRVLRPYRGRDGKSYYALNTGRVDDKGQPVLQKVLANTESFLSKEEWTRMDEIVLSVQKPELKIISRLKAAGLTKPVTNAMAITVLQHQRTRANAKATLSMDGRAQADRSRPVNDIGGIPLPIVHADGQWGMREILVSKNQGQGIDTTQIEESTRACAELLDKLALGTYDVFEYAGYPIYGLTNHPGRTLMTLKNPSTYPGWTPATLKDEFLTMLETMGSGLFANNVGVFYSRNWLKYLQDDYTPAYNRGSLMNRIMEMTNISFMEMTDYLSGWQIVMFDLNSRTIRLLTGMELQPVSWEEPGGQAWNLKIMGILVPEVRTDVKGDTGIIHGTAA